MKAQIPKFKKYKTFEEFVDDLPEERFILWLEKNTIPYEDLDKSFTLPKQLPWKIKRFPRKFKKRLNTLLDVINFEYNYGFDRNEDFDDIEQKFYYFMDFFHPNYKRFLTKKTLTN